LLILFDMLLIFVDICYISVDFQPAASQTSSHPVDDPEVCPEVYPEVYQKYTQSIPRNASKGPGAHLGATQAVEIC
jgi:hypothetical protein